ncbi:protein vreteno isoform X2 [Drosophila tropicalis]
MPQIDELINDWSKWNPMASDFYDESQNKYIKGTVEEAAVSSPASGDAADWQNRNDMQLKYPYLVVKKTKSLITSNLIINFFGRNLIYHLEYRKHSNVFLVYFHNVGSFESARKRISDAPNILNCFEGRAPRNNHRQQESQFPKPTEEMDQKCKTEPPVLLTDRGAVNMDCRTLATSLTENAHPMLKKTPLLCKADYSKGSMLSQHDPNQRYLNARYEFILEHHNVYMLEERIEKDQIVLNYRSGRRFTEIQATDLDELSSTGDHIDLKQCYDCDNYTLASCKYCQMPFCNAFCFGKLADQHKEYCNEEKSVLMPKPKKVEEGYAASLGPLMMPPSNSSVKITAFEQSNVLYVRSADVHNEVGYANVLTTVTLQGRKAPILRELPQCGQIVIYKMRTQILRALVLNVDNPNAIYVACIDFGNIEIVTKPHESLYACNNHLTALPRYAIPVILRKVPQRYITPNLREMIYELDETLIFEMKYSKREFDFNKGMQRVMLTELDYNRSLNRLFRTILLPVEPSLSDLGYKEDYLIHVPLPTGENVELFIMDNSFLKHGFIYCTIKDFAHEITQMQREIQMYAESIAKSTSFAPV